MDKGIPYFQSFEYSCKVYFLILIIILHCMVLSFRNPYYILDYENNLPHKEVKISHKISFWDTVRDKYGKTSK